MKERKNRGRLKKNMMLPILAKLVGISGNIYFILAPRLFSWHEKNFFHVLQLPNLFTQEYVKHPAQPVLIISYEMFVRNYEMLSKISFDLVVCDEGHRLKNTNIKTTSVSYCWQKEYVSLLIGLTMVRFHVLELIFSWSAHFTCPEVRV